MRYLKPRPKVLEGKKLSSKIGSISLFHRRQPSPNRSNALIFKPHSSFLPVMGCGRPRAAAPGQRGATSHTWRGAQASRGEPRHLLLASSSSDYVACTDNLRAGTASLRRVPASQSKRTMSADPRPGQPREAPRWGPSQRAGLDIAVHLFANQERKRGEHPSTQGQGAQSSKP